MSHLTETIELNDNYNFSPTNPSGVLGLYSTFDMSATYRTPATRFTTSGDFTYRKYLGPATSDMTFSETTGDGVNARFEHYGKTGGDREFIGASYRRVNTSVAQRAEFGFNTIPTTVKSDLIRYSIDGGISRQIDHLNSMNISADASTSTSSPSGTGTTDFTSFNARAGWTYRLSSLTNVTASVDTGLTSYDDAAQTRTVSQRVGGLISSKFSPLLSWTLGGGLSFFKTTTNGAPQAQQTAVPISPFIVAPVALAPPQAGTVAAPYFNATLTYRLLKNTNFGLNASMSTSTGLFGELSQQTSIGANLGHTINSYSSVSLGSSLARYPSPRRIDVQRHD